MEFSFAVRHFAARLYDFLMTFSRCSIFFFAKTKNETEKDDEDDEDDDKICVWHEQFRLF